MQNLYKRFKLTILLSIVTSMLWGQTTPQPNYTLTDNQSGTIKAYVARDYVSMKLWFHYAASGVNTFNAKIDAGLLFPPTTNTYADANGNIVTDPTQGAVVGSIPGTVSVTPTGAATYQIPIEVPAGINGMQPNLSLVYNSQGGAGALGIGWEVAGCSAITRGGKNIYFDGPTNNNIPVKFATDDALYLDGQRLIYLSGGSGNLTAGAIYATEVENYSTIVYDGTKFIATTIDGKVLEYGNPQTIYNAQIKNANNINDSRVLGWKLNKVTDTYGNSMTYTYTDYGQYLSHINYAGQSVEFAYNYTLQVAKKSYISDFLITQTKLLTAITTKSGSTVLKTVGFSYKSTSDNKLDKVSETAADNTKVNSTTIYWNSKNELLNNFDSNTIEIAKIGRDHCNDCDGNSIYFADVNGDGYKDFILLYQGVSPSTNGYLEVTLYKSDNTDHYSGNPDYHFDITPNDKNIVYKVMAQDINKDGKDEILLLHLNYIYQISYDNNQFSRSGISFKGNLAYNGSTPYFVSNGYAALFSDENKDSYPDLVIMPQGNFDNYKKYSQIFYGGSTGYSEGNSESNNDYVSDCYYYGTGGWDSQIGNGDFNADSKSDIMVYGNINKSAYVYDYKGATVFFDPSWNNLIKDTQTSNNMMYDFNNDGITDIIIQGNQADSYMWKLISGAPNYTHLSPINLPFHNSSATNCDQERELSQMIDYNGDGFMDVVIADETWRDHDGWTWLTGLHDFVQTDWYFYKNIGGTFTLDKQFTTNDRLPNMRPTISDMNGDGVDDLIFPRTSTDGGIISYDYIAFTLPNANRENLVNSITNGMGQTQSFEYTNYTNYNQTETIAPILNLKAPIVLANSFTDIDGNVTTYDYQDGKIHIDGKGFLGFKKVIAMNQIKNTKVVSEFDIEPTYYGMNLVKQVASTYDDKPISTLEQINEVKTIDSLKKRYIPVLKKRTSTDNLRNIITVTESLAYDSYWNVTQSKTTTGGISSTINTNYKKRIAEGVAYLPDNVSIVKQDGSDSSTRTIIYDYNTNGNIIKETKDSGNENQVVTEYTEFDQWGHATKIKVTANGKVRNSSLTYTQSGRFIETKKNNLEETSTYYWNETTGLLDHEEDPWNHATTYKYNTWGQVEETILLDGNRTFSNLQWATPGNEFGAKYYNYSEASASSPTWIWYDAFGRKICEQSIGLNGRKKSVFTEYYPDGRVQRVSEPTFNVSEKIWAATNTYDEYGRVKTLVTPMGETIYSRSTDGTTTFEKSYSTVGNHTNETPINTTEVIINDAGQTKTNKVNDKAVDYVYYASGLVKTTTPENGQSVTMEYDLQGNRTKLIDPDAGTTESHYDGFGKLSWEKQKVHNASQDVTTTNNYDDATGLLTSVVRTGNSTETTDYVYDVDLGHKSRIKYIAISNQHKQSYTYDNLGRVTNVKEEIDGHTYNSGTVYDALGRVKREIYPTGYYTVNSYDNYSNLIETKDRSDRLIWKVNDENNKGQLTSITKGNKTTTYGFDDRGFPTSIQEVSGIIDMEYHFDSKGNLDYRTDYSNPNLVQKENFVYDGLNRLTDWNISQNGVQIQPNHMGYDPTTGNIISKSDLGNFTLYYGGKNPNGSTTGRPDGSNIGAHALSTISGVPGSFPQVEAAYPTAELAVTYTDFKKIKTLNEKGKNYVITYGVDDERRKSVYTASGVSLTHYYLGDYEEEIDNINGTTKKIYYLSGGAILVQTGNSETLYYAYSDFQGSLVALADVNGNVVRYAYDPWGKRRDPNNWTQKDNRTTWIVNRGYTGHEHLDAFGIINMNGRVYDPLTAQFFSPDPYIQSPGNWLNYNRYGYCMGNPFKYTDPSGELFFYVIPSFSYSYYGGLQVNVSAGVGFPGMLSAGIGAGYNFKYGNWSVTANAGYMGFYGYAGYDSRAGFIAGAGFGFGASVLGNFSMSSNILSAGISYSANGGFSANALGFSYAANGLQFDPSMSASYTININIGVNRQSQTTSTTSTSVANITQILSEAAKELTANMIAAAEWPDFKTYDAGTLKTVQSVAPAKVLKAEVILTEAVANISQSGIDFIAKYEGFSATVYKDVAGLSTIGYGHLIKSGEHFGSLSNADGKSLLRKDASSAVNAVNKYVKVPLTQNQFDALTSFTYNVGTGSLSKSSLIKNINSGNNSMIQKSFLLWNKARVDGVLTPVQGLTNRRYAESQLFFK